MNAFLSFNVISKANVTVGIGPFLTAPTATETETGASKWQAGFAFVDFIVKSEVF
ncbi:hypothetical protein [Formosa maritima]|uniref:hypothetical protein n=1 Tax=Formosa maritima TaxID=2592046 RepID=UPI00131524B4|nr:hypothetical protein [Formosa maritima]